MDPSFHYPKEKRTVGRVRVQVGEIKTATQKWKRKGKQWQLARREDENFGFRNDSRFSVVVETGRDNSKGRERREKDESCNRKGANETAGRGKEKNKTLIFPLIAFSIRCVFL